MTHVSFISLYSFVCNYCVICVIFYNAISSFCKWIYADLVNGDAVPRTTYGVNSQSASWLKIRSVDTRVIGFSKRYPRQVNECNQTENIILMTKMCLRFYWEKVVCRSLHKHSFRGVDINFTWVWVRKISKITTNYCSEIVKFDVKAFNGNVSSVHNVRMFQCLTRARITKYTFNFSSRVLFVHGKVPLKAVALLQSAGQFWNH